MLQFIAFENYLMEYKAWQLAPFPLIKEIPPYPMYVYLILHPLENNFLSKTSLHFFF